MSVNEKIRLIRETKGLTQEQVTEIFEMPLSDLVDLSEKGALNITFNNQGKQRAEKEIALKDKEIALQQREIEHLNKLISLLEKAQSTTSV